MSKRKTWIKVKRGILEPKHRVELGIRVWLYLHILDRADWKTGKVLEWIDEAEAEIMSMSINTLRKQRKQLQDSGYITAVKGKHSQTITIHNWTDPRKYDGIEINKSDQNIPLSEKQESPLESPIDSPLESPLDYTAIDDPSLDSHITNHITQDKDLRSKNERSELIESVLSVCGLTWDTFKQNGKMRKLVDRTVKILAERGISPDDVMVYYGVNGWWWKEHWAGRDKNSKPRPEQIADTIDLALGYDSETARREYLEGWFSD